jgi:GTP-binding protein
MFIDYATVTFTAGNGGNGCMSFRREKYIARGGPDGGDGGKGGDIVLISKDSIQSLINFKFNPIIKAESGQAGSGCKRIGKSGKDTVIEVPVGTLIKNYLTNQVIFDFTANNQELIITKGGKGGVGNFHFRSSVNRAPRKTTTGGEGESLKAILELKLIAFAGLVGFPNAGKSTLITQISQAKPKIADYPFTTLIPHLGVVYQNFDSLVIADIPGIIEGAHQGKGVGLQFLKHIERNKLLLFLIDLSDPQTPPLEAFKILFNELKSYKTTLIKKKMLVVGNKIDVFKDNPTISAALAEYCSDNHIAYIEISALKKLNLEKLKEILFKFYHEK